MTSIMKKLQIPGPGCAKIVAFGVRTTPALVVEGVGKAVGKVPAPKEIKPFLG